MPLYFFDVDDDEQRSYGSIGIALDSQQDVVREVGHLLLFLANDRAHGFAPCHLTVFARDSDGRTVYTATTPSWLRRSRLDRRP